ncbi:helix-turn-helix domain-containing protein [Aliarcobacter cryaerophilus]|uniref:helix-turn-helix transcriptional regulator n=1 Tax=Aliarcobacter cryaerophilus TaxID=28198 RepID=UPI003DA6036F
MNIVQKLLRAKEVALYLGIGLSTVWLYAKQGKIKPIKISGRVTVFSIDEINREFGLEDIINKPYQESNIDN